MHGGVPAFRRSFTQVKRYAVGLGPHDQQLLGQSSKGS